MILYLAMETGMGLEEILELPVTVFNQMVKAINKIYAEKNRLDKEALNG